MTGVRAGAEVVFADLLRQLDWLLPTAGVSGTGEGGHEDVVADLLGFLARRMTQLHEAREAEVSRFLDWLEERLGCPIDALAGKTYVRAYHLQPEGVERLLTVIADNHPRRTSLDVAAPAGYGARNPERERIVEGYQRSTSILEPIVTQIELTDRLVDLIVYRLYGLTPEEAQLVDRSVGSPPPSDSDD